MKRKRSGRDVSGIGFLMYVWGLENVGSGGRCRVGVCGKGLRLTLIVFFNWWEALAIQCMTVAEIDDMK